MKNIDSTENMNNANFIVKKLTLKKVKSLKIYYITKDKNIIKKNLII